MASTIAAITTGTGGVVTTADATGNLNLLSGTTTVLSIASTGATVTGTFGLNGSTSGTATIVASAVAGTPTLTLPTVTGTLTTSGVPSGTILEFGGTSAPTGYLGCDGASVLRATYPDLFTAIGTTWGSADGTHFNVPDFRRRVPVGSGGTGTATLANSVGSTGGVEGFTLTGSQLPQYTTAISGGTGFADTGTLIGNTSPYSLFYASGGPSAIPIIQPSAVVLKIIKT
jgi:microcystin-dependent protein